MKLYVKINKVKNEHIVTFLKRCYSEGFTGYGHKFTTTYSNPECTEIQCVPCRRSFDDLLHVVKTYYPNVSNKHIAKQIEKLTKHNSVNNSVRLNLLFCPHADRWIMYENSNCNIDWKGNGNLYMSSYGSSYSERYSRGSGERSYMEILNLMGYTEIECIL
jgi:hypothetical protein